MEAFTNTGCFTHPYQLDRSYNCLVCNVILTNGSTSFPDPIITPKIKAKAKTLAGRALALAHFNPPKSRAAGLNPLNTFAGRIILNTFPILKHFHPGQRAEAPSHYGERFALSSEDEDEDEPAPKRQRRRPRASRSTRKKEAEQAYQPILVKPQTEQAAGKHVFTLDEIEALVDRRVAEKLQATAQAAPAAPPKRKIRQHKSSDFKTRAAPEEELELEGETIIVEAPDSDSDDGDEEPIIARRARKHPVRAAKDDSSYEESSPAPKTRGTTRTRFVSEFC